MTKVYRQGQILKAIRHERILTQDELARTLREQGIAATQVTLSRDIRDLGLVKTAAGYQLLKAPLLQGKGSLLLDARVAQNLLVLKTPAAHAGQMARAIDRHHQHRVVPRHRAHHFGPALLVDGSRHLSRMGGGRLQHQQVLGHARIEQQATFALQERCLQ